MAREEVLGGAERDVGVVADPGRAQDDDEEERDEERKEGGPRSDRLLPRDELTVPAKDCIRSDQCRHVLEQFPAERLAFRCESTSLVIA